MEKHLPEFVGTEEQVTKQIETHTASRANAILSRMGWGPLLSLEEKQAREYVESTLHSQVLKEVRTSVGDLLDSAESILAGGLLDESDRVEA